MATSPKKSAPRVAALRERRAAAGFIRLELWVRPEHVERIKRYAARVTAGVTAAKGGGGGR